MELDGTEVLNSSNGMTNIKLNYVNGQVIVLLLCEWPGYSPAFNAIKLVWNIIKQKVKSKMPKTQNELENAVDQALYSLPLTAVQSCIINTYFCAIDIYPRKIFLAIKTIF